MADCACNARSAGILCVLSDGKEKEPAYIGLIGSRKKRDVIYRALLNESFSESQLKKVHAPIGIPIAVETPEEIAVSIAAELIKARAYNNIVLRIKALDFLH